MENPEYINIKMLWNSEADEYNQWDNISEEEKIVFAVQQTRSCVENEFLLNELIKESKRNLLKKIYNEG